MTGKWAGRQSWLPQRRINVLAGIVAQACRSWLVQGLIRFWISRYKIDLSEVQLGRIDQYRRFNQFFVRRLKPTARQWPQRAEALASPVDGAFGECGRIEEGSLLQAKGQRYSLDELLADPRLARQFEQCDYATFYLSPRDYHRVHMPLNGRLIASQHIAGTLFSVNPDTALAVPRLYARNKRAVCLFSGKQGPFAVVLVGALVVGRIRLAWEYYPAPAGALRHWRQPQLQVGRGAEIGAFELGSTVVLLAPKGYRWNREFRSGEQVRLGEPLAMPGATD